MSHSPRCPDAIWWGRRASPCLDRKAVSFPCFLAVALLFTLCGAFVQEIQSVSILDNCFSNNTQKSKYYRAYMLSIYVARCSAMALENHAIHPWSEHVHIGNTDLRHLITLLKKLDCTVSILKLNYNLLWHNQFLITFLV